MNSYFEKYSVKSLTENYIGKYLNKKSRMMGFLLDGVKPFLLYAVAAPGEEVVIHLLSSNDTSRLLKETLNDTVTRHKFMGLLSELGYEVKELLDHSISIKVPVKEPNVETIEKKITDKKAKTIGKKK